MQQEAEEGTCTPVLEDPLEAPQIDALIKNEERMRFPRAPGNIKQQSALSPFTHSVNNH